MDTLDPQVKNLVSAIGRAETGEPSAQAYSKRGASGEFGRYQFMPSTYKEWAKKHLGDENAPPTIENQNKIAYAQVKEWKDMGLSPAQIASKWNSGRENAYKEGLRGTNSKGVAFDVPAYAQKVSHFYEEAKGKNTVGSSPVQKTETTTEQPSLAPTEKLGDEVRRRREEIEGIKNSDQSGFSKVLQQGGQVAGLAGSLVMRGLSAITPNFIERPVAGALEGTGKEIAKAPLVQKGVEKYQEFAGNHPEAAANIGAVGNIAGLLPQTKALGKVVAVEKGLVKTGLKTAGKGFEKVGLKSPAKDVIIDMVTPKMTAKQTQAALKAGKGTTSGMLKNISLGANPKTQRVAESVKDVLDPSKNLVDNINITRDALSREADTLKNSILQADHPYVFKELQSRLRNVPKPISVKANSIWNTQFDLVRQAAMDIAKKNGGKISGLLDARKEFDELVKREIPNLYNETETPMKNAIKDIRQEMNEFISDNLPEGLGFKESLAKQADMFEAIDAMASKAVSEVGTNTIERTAKRYPKTTGILRGASGTLGAGKLLNVTGIID